MHVVICLNEFMCDLVKDTQTPNAGFYAQAGKVSDAKTHLRDRETCQSLQQTDRKTPEAEM